VLPTYSLVFEKPNVTVNGSADSQRGTIADGV
jgi:hypothetical protein